MTFPGENGSNVGEGEALAGSLVAQAKADSLAFFGVENPIPQPSQLLLETLVELRRQGSDYQGVYFPSTNIDQNVKYPGQRTKIGSRYYEWLKDRQLRKGSPDLLGKWAIIDARRRADHPLPATDPGFEVSANDQDDKVFPKLAQDLNLSPEVARGIVEIRRPTVAEFNFLGNLDRFGHLGDRRTSEAMHDMYAADVDTSKQLYVYTPRTIISGSSVFGGVGQVDYILPKDEVRSVTFRAVIIFS